jgi:hypothetical protein
MPFELKKSSSQMYSKIKRQSINFLQKADSASRNSTVRGSFLGRQDSSTLILQNNNGSQTAREMNLFSTFQNRPTSNSDQL